MSGRRPFRAEQSGFTLIELLVVVVILGILSAVVVFAMRGSREKALDAAIDTDQRILRTALELYCANEDSYPDKPDPMQQLVDEGYLSSSSEHYIVSTGNTGDGNCPGDGPRRYTLTPTGTIELLDDGPETWAKVSAVDLHGVDCIEASGTTTCVAVGEGGAILRGTKITDAQTMMWSETLGAVTQEALHDVSCSDLDTCTAVGANETILRRTPASPNWSDQSRAPAIRSATRLVGISCPTALVCVAVGDQTGDGFAPIILTTADGGGTWIDAVAPATVPLLDVDCPSALVCFASGFSAGMFGGTILASVNGGASWVKQISLTPFDVFGVSCTSVTHCVAVDNGGGSLRTSTGGNPSWTYNPTSLAEGGGSMNKVSCLLGAGLDPEQSSTCFAVGYQGTTGRSTDGGETWTSQDLSTPVDPLHLNGVSCTPSACRAVGTSGYILRN